MTQSILLLILATAFVYTVTDSEDDVTTTDMMATGTQNVFLSTVETMPPFISNNCQQAILNPELVYPEGDYDSRDFGCLDRIDEELSTDSTETTVRLSTVSKGDSDLAPAFRVPELKGPVVIDRRWVEFYCVVPTDVTSKDAVYNVTFLFDRYSDPKIEVISVRPPSLQATLHEKFLKKHIGQSISCQVYSFWNKSKHPVLSETRSSDKEYWIGVEVSPRTVSVFEGAQNPVLLTIRSTIPITCGSSVEDNCQLTFRIKTGKNVLVRRKNSGMCRHVLKESDWNYEEQKAYGVGEEIELFAKMDPYKYSYPRTSILTMEVDPIKNSKTLDGEEYGNIWSKYRLPAVRVYHYDRPQGVCRSTGDPHVTTFDGYYYTIYPSGQFTYLQTTRGVPIEIQVRHKPCGQRVSCVCGVAMREGDVIIAADMCGKDSLIHYITYNDDLKGAEIRRNGGGRSFELVLPSKIKATAYANYWGLNLCIYVTASEFGRIEGLCGTFDGIYGNDLTIKGQGGTIARYVYVDEAVESWRVPLGKSLFDGFISNLSNTTSFNDLKFCSCTSDHDKCEISKTDQISDYNYINIPVSPKRRFIRNTIGRRKRFPVDNSADPFTDDIDSEYDSSSFNFTEPIPSPDPENHSWPTDNKINETEAEGHCRRVLWDNLPVKAMCENYVNQSGVEAIIDKCILDIKLTDDLNWANDKVPEVQNLCVVEMITTVVTQSNTTNTTDHNKNNASLAIEDLMRDIQEMASVTCLPQDCSGHGTCKNGTCECDIGFIGPDCAVSENSVPEIVRVIGSKSCDLDKAPCRKIEMVTKNVTETSTLSCKVEILKFDKTRETKFMSGSAATMMTTSCPLPTDDFIGQLRLLKNQTSEQDEEMEFFSLPTGNPVLHYAVSISNNRISYSDSLSFVLYDSRCFNWVKDAYSRKNATCLIRGYCFANLQHNPLNPKCEICNPAVSADSWTKISGSEAFCAPCKSSPCPSGTICQPRSRGRYYCLESPLAEWTGVIVISFVALIAVSLTVAVVFFIIRH